MTEYLVIYEPSETGWGAYCPDLPGLGVTGDTQEEVERLIGEGIAIHIESLREQGQTRPRAHVDRGDGRRVRDPPSQGGSIARWPDSAD